MKKSFNLFILLYFIAFLLNLVEAKLSYASTIGVPGNYTTIQAAIDAAQIGDIVVIADGTYTGEGNIDLHFNGKAITVKSENGPENCIIDCDNKSRGFTFTSGETEDSILSGITIKNGYEPENGAMYAREGGAIYCSKSSPFISNCIFENNKSDRYGGGLFLNECYSKIFNCVFYGNSSYEERGAMFIMSSEPVINNCTFINNDLGIRLIHSFLVIKNSIIWHNELGTISAYYSDIVVLYSNVQGGIAGHGNVEGNIDAPPFFVRGYHLGKESPCIDSGFNEATKTDIHNVPRPQGQGYDMGATEFAGYILSTTHNISICSAEKKIEVLWGFLDNNIIGYSILFDNTPRSLPEPIVNSSYTKTVSPSLNDGQYYFHVRYLKNNNQWSDFALHDGPYCINTSPPSIPNIINSSHLIELCSNVNTIELSWEKTEDDLYQISGYSILWDTNPLSNPEESISITETKTVSPPLVKGSNHYFHLLAVNELGIWSDPLHYGPFCIGSNIKISDIPNQYIAINTESEPIGFSITKADGSMLTDYTISFESNNTKLVPVGNIDLEENNNGNIILTITPATNEWGSSIITIIVKNKSNYSEKSFLFKIHPFTIDFPKNGANITHADMFDQISGSVLDNLNIIEEVHVAIIDTTNNLSHDPLYGWVHPSDYENIGICTDYAWVNKDKTWSLFLGRINEFGVEFGMELQPNTVYEIAAIFYNYTNNCNYGGADLFVDMETCKEKCWSIDAGINCYKKCDPMFDIYGHPCVFTYTSTFSYEIISSSTISCNLSQKTLPIGKSIRISGSITPVHGEAGSYVGIRLKKINSTQWSVYKSTISNYLGMFSLSLDCDDFSSAGQWIIQTWWEGNSNFEGATSEEYTLTITKGTTQVTLDVTSQDLKLGNQISISGKLTPTPDCGNYSNMPIDIKISGPDASYTETVMTDDKFGHFVLENFSLNSLGVWQIQARFQEDQRYKSSSSEQISVRVVETAGYAIIVQGKFGNEEGIQSHNKTCNAVYKHLKQKGLLDEDIQYFNYTINQDDEKIVVDVIPSKTAINESITQWASQKMNDKAANLYIIMIDHGVENKFFIHPDEILSRDLSEWTDTLQNNLIGQSKDQEIIFVLGFCFSGSFIDDLSGPNRVIITSAGPNEYSFKGPMDIDNIREGEYFVSEFFKEVSLGKSVKQSFIQAVAFTEIFTANDLKSVNAPYYDISDQHPLLDDNSDGIGSNEIIDYDGDGVMSENLFIGVNTMTPNAGNVYITNVSDAIFLTTTQHTTDALWATVSDDNRLRTLWIEIKQPAYHIQGSETGQQEMDLPKIICKYNSNTRRYECKNLVWQGNDIFTDSGTYQILFFAKDDQTNEVSPVMETRVYKNKSTNQPPEDFSLLIPEDKATVVPTLSESKDNYLIFMSWEDSVDPDDDRVSYTLMVSTDDPLFSYTKTICIENIDDDYYLYPLSLDTSKWNIQKMYWKVLAIDQYGAICQTKTNEFLARDGNASEAWIRGRILDSSTQNRITRVNIKILDGENNQYPSVNRLGEFKQSLRPGNYDIEIEAKGYISQVYNINLTEGAMRVEQFKLTRRITMENMISILKLMADHSLETNFIQEIEDIKQDNDIGLAEAIYIMQQLSKK